MHYYLVAQTQNNQHLTHHYGTIHWKPVLILIVDEPHLNLTASLTGL
jgi:hypothetical protein